MLSRLTDTLPDYIGFTRESAPGACREWDAYRPGDACPRHVFDAICAQCERHVNFDACNAPEYAIRVWGYRDPEPSSLDGVMTSGPEWWCPECVARFELSRDVERCAQCGDAFHPDLEVVHGGVCDGCHEKGNAA